MSLDLCISSVKGIGEKTKALLSRLGIETKLDFIRYYPRDYERYGDLCKICDLKVGDKVCIYASSMGIPILKRVGTKSLVIVEVSDGSGKLELTWFNMPFLKTKIKKGVHYIFRGKLIRKGNAFSIPQPEILTPEEYRQKKKALQPIYSLTKGITGNFFRKTVSALMMELSAQIEFLPANLKKELHLPDLRYALEEIHFPESYSTLVEARKRLVFDEFFLFLLSIDRMKKNKHSESSAFPMKNVFEVEKFLKSLPFEPTNAQTRVWKEIEEDFKSGFRMNRLIQGDVGSGKTLLAVLSCLFVVKNGYQASVMVPTEVLARQHFETFSSFLQPFGVRTVLLTGSTKGKERKKILEDLENGEADIVIGTHALIQDKVLLARLAFVITDEQHRFGVRQREKLIAKGSLPHVLVMSATPIPRTLAVILYGDLDISFIDLLPAERLPIKNCVVGEEYRYTSYDFIKEEVLKGHQAYIICPMVEKKEDSDELADVVSYTEELQSYYGKNIKIRYLHGRLKQDEKNEIMDEFSTGKIDVLVSTTVVEVGVNVPNATVMLIENADRFGLASLHQLRGRIGRGGLQSYCIFMSSNQSREAMERLMILKQSNDGFKIAEEDLKLRGAGDVFGIRQSGDMEFSLGDVIGDASILKLAGDLVKRLSDKSKNECYDRGRVFYHKSFIYGDEIHTL